MFKSSFARLFALSVCLLALVVTACSPVSITLTATTAPSPIITPSSSPAASPDKSHPTKLNLWVAGIPKDNDILTKQIKNFEAAEPGVSVTIQVISYEKFDDELLTAGKNLPDIATLSLNAMVYWQQNDSLSPINIKNFKGLADFGRDALNSGKIDGKQYGIPLQQYGCAPVYQYLSLFKTSNEALALMDYLTQPDAQNQAYQQSDATARRIPTRKKVYDALKLGCLPITLTTPTPPKKSVTPIRLSPDVIKMAIEITRDKIAPQFEKLNPGLKPEFIKLLNGQKPNPFQSVAISQKDPGAVSFPEEELGMVAAAFKTLPGQRAKTQSGGSLMLAAYRGPAAPLESSSAVIDEPIGAIYVQQTIANVPTSDNGTTKIDPGTYSLSCNSNSCSLTNLDPSGESVNGIRVEVSDSLIQAATPTIVLEYGSITVCIPFTHYCAVIGK